MTMRKIYVALDGADSNRGTLERPFKSLEKAKTYAYEILKQTQEDIEINVRKGSYYLASPLVFTHQEKIREDQRLILKAYEQEEVTLSGGQKFICDWKKYKDHIWMAQLPKGEGIAYNFDQLFINGKRQTKARYPKKGLLSLASEEKTPWPHESIKYNPETFPKKQWDGVKNAILHIFPMNYWGNLQWEVKSIDSETSTIYLGKGGYQINDVMQGIDATGIDERSKFFVENLFEALEEPGEWYLDKENALLYVIPEEDIQLQKALIEASGLKQVVEIRGSQEKPVDYITLSGFRIAHTQTTFLEEYEATSLGDFTIHRGGAVFLEGTHNCTIEGCYFDQVGGNALFVNNHNRHIDIKNNIIQEVGDSGICIVGNKYMTIGSNKCYPSHIIVSDNIIHDIGVFGKQTAGVFISVSEKNVISHNHIYNLPRAAICINDGTWGGHIIEFNDIHDTVKETGDHGPFNSWGRERFWCLEQSHGPVSHESGDVLLDTKHPITIRNNRFEDYKGWGIDLDDGSSNYHVYNNLCIGISIKLREGNYRTIENNIFINCANPPGFHIGYENNSDIFRHNIIVMNSQFDNPEVDINFKKESANGAIYELIGPPTQGKWLKEINNNLFFNDIDCFKAIVHMRPLGSKTCYYTLREWQEIGFDTNSIYVDPLFEDVKTKDFRIKENSSAYQIGFKPFTLDEFGVTSTLINRYDHE